MLVDSHCHLDYPDFEAEGVAQIIARAQSAGIGHFLTISTEIAKFSQVLKIAQSSDLIHCTVGTHPHHAADEGEVHITKEDLIALTHHEKVVGIGETGLDYYYDHSPRDEQQRIFSTHIEASCETGLPLVIHTRDADEDTTRLMRDVGQGKATGVMHCFSGGQKLAEESLALGFYISFSGILTFKKAEDLREVARHVPMARMLVETDSPYLAPMPHRGKCNEPAYVVHTAQVLAELKGVSPEEIAQQTTDNFFKLFNKAKK